MGKNIRIAKELVKIAKNLISSNFHMPDSWYDPPDDSTGIENMLEDADFEFDEYDKKLVSNELKKHGFKVIKFVDDNLPYGDFTRTGYEETLNVKCYVEPLKEVQEKDKDALIDELLDKMPSEIKIEFEEYVRGYGDCGDVSIETEQIDEDKDGCFFSLNKKWFFSEPEPDYPD